MAWAERLEAAAAGGLDVRAGQVLVRKLLHEWLEVRAQTVAPKTYRTDSEVHRLLSPELGARSVGSVSSVEIERWLLTLRVRHGLGDASIRRYRASMSAFFAWAVTENRIAANPVVGAALPRPVDVAEEMRPWSEAGLAQVVAEVARRDVTLADVVLVAGWTGVRWGELRALRVGDVSWQRSPRLRVARSQSEGQAVKAPKAGRARWVPLSDAVIPAVKRAAEGKQAGDLLMTTGRGGALWASTFRRTVRWDRIAEGRRIHDLRHTAACLWLARGVDLGTVRAWMGHASIATTERYLHHLGSEADVRGLERLNAPGGAYGAHGYENAPSWEGANR